MKCAPKIPLKMLPLIVLPLAQLCVSSVGAAPQQPPTFDVNPSCKAAAAASGTQDRLQGCLDSEKNARAQLVKEWGQFPAASRATCYQASTAGGEPTYTEFITCLEMDRDAKLKPNGDPMQAIPASAPGLKSAIERAHGH